MQFKKEHIEQIKTIVPDAQIHIIEGQKTVIDTYLPKADILIFSPLDHTHLINFSKAKKLRWVHLTAAGASVIAEKLKQTDILLTNSSGIHPIPIAEHVFSFMLMFSRSFTTSYKTQLTERKWDQENIASHITELYQSTIGIVGLGRIGKRVAKIAKAFDMHVIALSHNKIASQDSNVDEFYPQNKLNMLLHASDFVINCLPLTKETAHFFTKTSFQQMKKTAYFINIGRGKTVNEHDLIDILKQKRIAGAGLDVFEEIPLSAKSELWKLDNVIITPYYAGWTPKYIDRMIEIFCLNLKNYINDHPMPTLVNKERGY